MEKNPLKFYQLAYQISEIRDMILTYAGIDNFVFSYYSAEPGLPLQLAAYVRTNVDNIPAYSAEFNILDVYGYSVLEINGPVILGNNFIPIDVMKELIGYPGNQEGSGYLVFTPVLNDDKHVYYDVYAYDVNEIEAIRNPGGGSTTNPSPPATMTIPSAYLV